MPHKHRGNGSRFCSPVGPPGQKAWTEPERPPRLARGWPCCHPDSPSGGGRRQTAAPCSCSSLGRCTDAATQLKSPGTRRRWGWDPRRCPGWRQHLGPQRTAPGRWLEKGDTYRDPSGSWFRTAGLAQECVLVCVWDRTVVCVFCPSLCLFAPCYQHGQSTGNRKNNLLIQKLGLYTQKQDF